MEKAVKIILGIRAVLWSLATIFTIHWIYWSFKLYDQGTFDPHDYATALRPIMYKDLIITFVIICLSFLLRHVSDTIKKVNRGY